MSCDEMYRGHYGIIITRVCLSVCLCDALGIQPYIAKHKHIISPTAGAKF